ncbi:hypothetical protein K431DRAFT_215138 [Polychaeton citri CBS 116435]|uniref:Coupling of ubiquitin conjugation to ER degradation protein 1 n=1 Tax=Polychaeton citri CBS 116435 TaxID=1314669 RepID=A0A9P4URP9_9PEZI|nr:hypothetical protein K431DRAFT_215138 [Polychaeton citri CBS 116435]
MADQSINLPQIIAVALVCFFAIRWFISKPSSPAEPGQRSSRSRRNQVDPSKVEHVVGMFPQYDRRTIAWDLQRNGGSVEATCNRLLQGPGLETPPPSFQPPLSAAVNASEPLQAITKQEPSRPDLITRYNLQSRVSDKGKEAVTSETQERDQKKATWSSDKASRANALKKRREEMVLAARRAMEAKEIQQ